MARASSAAKAWAASGAMALTGRPEGAGLVPPDGIVRRIRALGEPLGLDPLPLLGERAAAFGLARRGSVSCGGTAHLVRALDDWVAVNLARDDDRAAVAAWLEVDPFDGEPWSLIESVVATRTAASLIEQATLLGLPCARLAETQTSPCDERMSSLPVAATPFAGAGPRVPSTIVDLSSLWAGPLCSRLLADAGARVTKVESTQRPDGARRGPAAFFDRLNAGKQSVCLDLTTSRGVGELRGLIRDADVVIEASRPRALRHMGIVGEEILASEEGPAIWVSITGYGRQRDRAAFGDDAAVAGGLVAIDENHDPLFVADAVADPLTGVAAASAVFEGVKAGGRWLIDVSMAGVAAFTAGPDRGSRWRPADLPRSSP